MSRSGGRVRPGNGNDPSHLLVYFAKLLPATSSRPARLNLQAAQVRKTSDIIYVEGIISPKFQRGRGGTGYNKRVAKLW